jgi:hypothetical protein
VVKGDMWVVVKAYDVENLKTNIVSVEPYLEFIAKHGRSYFMNNGKTTDIINAIDALDAWKKAREMHNERD